MQVTLINGALVRSCHVCSQPYPCERHGARTVGERQAGNIGRGEACRGCGYHVCSCLREFFGPKHAEVTHQQRLDAIVDALAYRWGT